MVDEAGLEPAYSGLRGRTDNQFQSLVHIGEPGPYCPDFSRFKRSACYFPTPGPDQDPFLACHSSVISSISAHKDSFSSAEASL